MKKLLMPICMLILAGCYYDKEDQLYPSPVAGSGCDTANISYAKDIAPILNANCALGGCHDAVTKSYNHDLSNYDGVVASVKTGRFLGSVMQDAGYLAMPKSAAKLGDCELSKISAWINAGTPQ